MSSTPIDTEGSLASQATESASSIESQHNPTSDQAKETAATTATQMDTEDTPTPTQDHSAMPPHSNCSHTQAPTAASTSSSTPAQSSHTVTASVPTSSLATAAKATANTSSSTPATISAPQPSPCHPPQPHLLLNHPILSQVPSLVPSLPRPNLQLNLWQLCLPPLPQPLTPHSRKLSLLSIGCTMTYNSSLPHERPRRQQLFNVLSNFSTLWMSLLSSSLTKPSFLSRVMFCLSQISLVSHTQVLSRL